MNKQEDIKRIMENKLQLQQKEIKILKTARAVYIEENYKQQQHIKELEALVDEKSTTIDNIFSELCKEENTVNAIIEIIEEYDHPFDCIAEGENMHTKIKKVLNR